MKLLRITSTISVIVVFLTACASVDIQHKFNDASFRYERALRWENPEKASMFQKEPQQFSDSDLKRFQNIKITGYKVINAHPSEHEVKQTVEIQYYSEDQVVLHTVLDHQVWSYDEKLKQWYIMTPLPVFK